MISLLEARIVMVDGALGIIAGTGFYDIALLSNREDVRVETPYGPAHGISGTWHGRTTFFLSRHGVDHSVPPHMVNYRANLWAMREKGVKEILAVNVVGGIGLEAGELAVPDDFLNYSHTRPITFFDGTTPEGVVHVDMSEPYSPRLRRVWLQACSERNADVIDGGIYGCFDGPRFETRAEIRVAQSQGVTVVGMTGVPEVVLSVELGIPYAALCLVANPAAGLGDGEITVDDVNAVVAAGATQVMTVMDRAAEILAADER
jgi:5'-deoxy-5'-methylthioadenosine phosphorylase